MDFIDPDRREYFMQRATGGCSCCRALTRVDPISALCKRCYSRYCSHGSPLVEKPKLQRELEVALFRIISKCSLGEPTRRFHDWMLHFSSPSKANDLKRLCWLNFFKLKANDGEPLLSFRDVLIQSLAVTLFDRNNGRIDHRRKQLHYLLGRSVCCVWNKRRQVADGVVYDQWERRLLQRKPRVMREAFEKIFLGGGISRFIAKLNKQI